MSEYNKRKTQKIFLYYLGIICYYISLTGVVITPALTYWGYLRVTRYSFFAFLLLSLVGISLFILSHIDISNNICVQMASIYLFINILFFCILLRNYNTTKIDIKFVLVEAICLLVGLLFWSLKIKKRHIYIKNCVRYIKNNILYILICIAAVVLSIEQITKYIRWDSIHYYAYIERIKEFTFSPNDIGLLKASGHISYAYVLIYSLGESLIPENGYGVRIENIIIFASTIYIFAQLLGELFIDGKKYCNVFATMLFAVTPIILGPIHNIDVEVLIVFLVVALFYACIREKYIVGMIISLLLVFTKETSVIILFIFGCSLFIKQFIINFNKKEINMRLLSGLLGIVLPLFSFLVHYCMGNVWGTSNGNETKDKFNSFGLNKVVILSKIKQMFFLNYSWIIWFTIIVTVIYCIICKKKNIIKFKGNMLLVVTITYVAFLIIQTTYITYTFPRYIMLQYFFASIYFCWAINNLDIRMSLKKVYLTVIIIVTLIQNFVSLDLVSKILYKQVKIGEQNINIDSPLAYLNNDTLLINEDAEFLMFSPYGDMNRQFSYLDCLIDELLEKIDYSDDSLIIYPDDFSPRTSNIYTGMWGDNYYNKKTKHLEQVMDLSLLRYKNLYRLNIVVDYNNSSLDKLETLKYKNKYYLRFPYSDVDEAYICSHYNIVDIVNVSYRGWSLTAYKIEEKE